MRKGRLQADVEDRIDWLLRAGLSHRQIAYECRVDRETVARVAQRRQIAPIGEGIRRCELCDKRVIGACIACANKQVSVDPVPKVDRRPDRDDPRPWELAEFYNRQHDRRTAAGEMIKAADEERLAETLDELVPGDKR